MSDQGYAGQVKATDWGSEFNTLSRIISQMIGQVVTIALVQVKAVSNDGGVSPTGTVDVKPLVGLTDKAGQITEHGIISGLPYHRLQGGTDAVIIDPKIDDIGAALICHRDISAVKNSKAPGPPGSFRRFDWADGLYLGSFLGPVPTQWIRVSTDGIEIHTPHDCKIVSTGNTTITASGDVDVTASGDVTVQGGTVNVEGSTVNLGGTGGAGVARIGDAVSGGVITGGSTVVKAT